MQSTSSPQPINEKTPSNGQQLKNQQPNTHSITEQPPHSFKRNQPKIKQRIAQIQQKRQIYQQLKPQTCVTPTTPATHNPQSVLSIHLLHNPIVNEPSVKNNTSTLIQPPKSHSNNEINLPDYEHPLIHLHAPMCVFKNSLVTMSDGHTKSIQSVTHGDEVLVSKKIKTNNNFQDMYWSKMLVSRLVIQTITPNQTVSFVIFKKDCLGTNKPSNDLYITANHPLLYKNTRVPAKYFSDMVGVIFHDKVRAGDHLPIDNDGLIRLYDIQFDDDEFYQANDVVIQSRSPRSMDTPMPIDYYYNRELYTDEVVWDTYDNPVPLKLSRI